MKKLLIIFGFFFITILLIYKVFFYFDAIAEKKQVNEQVKKTRLSTGEIAQLQEGDFILRRGYGYFSDIIAKHLNTTEFDVTHCGILTKKNKEWYVIHSLSSDVSDVDGMQIQSLKEFLYYSQPKKILITRVKNATLSQRDKIAVEGLKLLDLKIPFDHQGDIEDDSKMYCTEMIWYILEKKLNLVKIPVDKKERENFFFSMKCMYDVAYFDVIIDKYK